MVAVRRKNVSEILPERKVNSVASAQLRGSTLPRSPLQRRVLQDTSKNQK